MLVCYRTCYLDAFVTGLSSRSVVQSGLRTANYIDDASMAPFRFDLAFRESIGASTMIIYP
jgi:hypothetical protein